MTEKPRNANRNTRRNTQHATRTAAPCLTNSTERKISMKRACFLFSLFAFLGVLTMSSPLEAKVLQKLIRQTSRVADDIPLRPMEETMSSPGTRKMAQEFMEARKLDAAIPYSRQLIREIETTSDNLMDPTVLKTLNKMDDAGLEVVMLANHGAKNITTAVPDIARRAELLRKVDADTLCVIGRFDDLAEEANVFQKSLTNPELIRSPEGMRRVTLDDFGAFFKKFGQKGHDFWMNTVKPNWKWWAGGTALAAILLTPEEDLDKAIEAVGWAAGKVIDTAGKVVEKTAETAGKALEDAGKTAEKSVWAIVRGFCSTWTGSAILFVSILLIVLYVLSNQVVQWFFRAIGRMCVSVKNFLCPKRS